MNIIDIILIALLAVVIGFAVRHTVKQRRAGGCGCGCANCTGSAACHGGGASSANDDHP